MARSISEEHESMKVIVADKISERGVELLRKAARTGFPPAKEILAKLGQPAQ